MSAPLPSSAAAKHRILVIDDEEIVLVGLRETLRRAGYEVVTGTNALAGLEALRTGPFAVVITDQQMPWMTGLEFLAQVKDIQPDASRILVTAVLSLDTVVEAINQGEIYRFVIKPWLREELLATVTNAVQRYELVCQHAALQKTTLEVNQHLTELNRSLQDSLTHVQGEQQRLLAANSNLSSNVDRAVRLCAHVVQTLCPYLGSQIRRTTEVCAALADTLSLTAEERIVLDLGSRLYDIGLVGTSEDLLRRWQEQPTTLDAAERRMIEQHSVFGQELVQFSAPLDQVGTVIRSHHENFDGSGYPDGLAGNRIPWLSRLLAVAVAYAHSPRPEQNGVDRVREGSGSAFDPDAVRAFLRAIPKLKVGRRAREILLSELRPGMVLANGIYTANGLLLVPQDQPLSAPAIEQLVHHNRLQPITQTLTVYC